MGQIKINSNKQRIALLNKQAYVSRAVTYTNISSNDVLDYAASNSGINRGQLSYALFAIVQSFQNFLMNGHSVTLDGVGIFRIGINAKAVDTEEEVSTNNIKRRRIIFTPSTKVKAMLKGLSFTGISSGDEAASTTPSTQPAPSGGGSGSSSTPTPGGSGSGSASEGDEVG